MRLERIKQELERRISEADSVTAALELERFLGWIVAHEFEGREIPDLPSIGGETMSRLADPDFDPRTGIPYGDLA